MTENPTPHDDRKRSGAIVKNKKPYQKPAYRYERVFETSALTCGKLAGTTNACNVSRKTS